MSFHIEYRLGGKPNCAGASRGDAILRALQAKKSPALIVEGEGTTFGRGEVVAVILGAGEVITPGPQPAWWDLVSEQTRSALLAGAPLSADVVTDVTSAGGTVVATAWESGPMSNWELSPASDQDWVRAQAAIRQVRG
ncbi:hypothetical protein WDU99_07735 [Microbacterium sp. Mu-80]|uniref:Uncharacterized protein n=1 Tax=Microbacterium bandirmense TaxID=3122050 RepID=A0ABU8LBP4_9MICO